MSWNDSNKPNDPWNSKNGPPDLDELLKKFINKLKRLAGKKRPVILKAVDNDTKHGANEPPQIPALLGGAAILFILLWLLSGIFIVNPAEQAVILRFGKYHATLGSGPHWFLRGVEQKILYNVDRVSDYSYSAQMLTKDENLVMVSLVVQYRISDLKSYLFNVADPEESLRQATSSALRQVVGNTTLDQIITEGREAWGGSVHESLSKILDRYKTGISIVNVSPQPARAPENVQDAFDDAIKAQEDEKRFKEQAFAYQASVVPIAQGKAKRILAESKAWATQAILRAQGEVSRFLALLPQYDKAPQVTAQRMYIEAYETILQKSSKVLLGSNTGNLAMLPLEKILGSDILSNTAKKNININSGGAYEGNLTHSNDLSFPIRNDTRQSRE
jgi:membrane protease subunit HflK